jgi:voltage-gated potassium channel
MSDSTLKKRLHRIIFEAETVGGKVFDVGLILLIFASVAVIMLDSMQSFREEHHDLLYTLEWCFTFAFTIEYLLRVYCLDRPMRYVFSFYGVIDVFSILPTLLSILLPGSEYFASLRVLRCMRIFRIMKLIKYVGEAEHLKRALLASIKKIVVFITFVIFFVVILGSIMYVIEGENNGFTSIPRSVYWAIVTLTTVGYGDISPNTVPGQFFASMVMLSGYAILAVPTGIVSLEMSRAFRQSHPTQSCLGCGHEGHDDDAVYCKRCAHTL